MADAKAAYLRLVPAGSSDATLGPSGLPVVQRGGRVVVASGGYRGKADVRVPGTFADPFRRQEPLCAIEWMARYWRISSSHQRCILKRRSEVLPVDDRGQVLESGDEVIVGRYAICVAFLGEGACVDEMAWRFAELCIEVGLGQEPEMDLLPWALPSSVAERLLAFSIPRERLREMFRSLAKMPEALEVDAVSRLFENATTMLEARPDAQARMQTLKQRWAEARGNRRGTPGAP